MQSNLLFQPLINPRLTEKQGLIVRPMVPVANSIPYVDQRGQDERTTGFGDTVLALCAAAFAPRRPAHGRRSAPTFIFPTASTDLLSQHTWQVGPDAGAVLLGKHFIGYALHAMVQDRRRRPGHQPAERNLQLHVLFANGWTLGTQPQLSVDWEARGGERGTFGLGPQLGKMCKCGGLPTLLQLQVQFYPIRPDGGGPKWNIQLQATPTIPALLKKALF